MWVRSWTVSLAFVATLALAGLAQAAPFTVNGYDLGENVWVASAAYTGNVQTAQLDVTFDGVRGTSYCIDLAQTIWVNTYDMTPVANLATLNLAPAGYMFDTFAPTLSTLSGSDLTAGITGLQLAIWETQYETSQLVWDLTSGDFNVGGVSAEALWIAQGLLGGVPPPPVPPFGGVAALSGTIQDQLFRPLPEPGAALLFLVGGAVVASRLRRAS